MANQYVSFILDETGSMNSVKDQTISGYNEYIDTLKQEKEVLFTLTKFNSDKVEVVYDAVKIKKVKPLNVDTYQPSAMTPLYDAIGETITSLERATKGKKGKKLVVIQTDGLENASKEYNRKMIFEIIEKKKKDDWTFVFLGADQDAYAASAQLGISRGNTRSYASAKTKDAFGSVAKASRMFLRSEAPMTEDFFEDEEEE